MNLIASDWQNIVTVYFICRAALYDNNLDQTQVST